MFLTLGMNAFTATGTISLPTRQFNPLRVGSSSDNSTLFGTWKEVPAAQARQAAVHAVARAWGTRIQGHDAVVPVLRCWFKDGIRTDC